MKLKRIGVDLAKNVFQIHGVDSHEQIKLRKQVKRHNMLNLFRQIEPCVVAMETGSYLSHGAIVAREFGIPAVVNLPGILTQLRDGEQLEVNGNQGVVRRL